MNIIKHISGIIVAGPTASGKSDMAVTLARVLNGVVINCDSKQIYSGLEIITDQPNKEICDQIPHALYGYVDPEKTWSAYKWITDVTKTIEKTIEQSKIPILTGGTGMYIDFLLNGFDHLECNEEKEKEFREKIETCPKEEIRNLLIKKDPDAANNIHPNDSYRNFNALKSIELLGQSILERKNNKKPIEGKFIKSLVITDKDTNIAAINNRIQNMVKAGVLEEVNKLKDLFLRKPDLPAIKASGLRAFLKHIEGEITLQEAINKAEIETRQYAKRQRCWFKNKFAASAEVYTNSVPKALEQIINLIESDYN